MILDYIGTLFTTIACFIIAVKEILKYKEKPSRALIHATVSFILAGFVFLVAFLLIPGDEIILFPAPDPLIYWVMLLSLILQFALILEAFENLEVPSAARIGVVIGLILLAVLGLILPIFNDSSVNTIIIVVFLALNTILFFACWKRNDDIESLGFAIGLILVIIGDLTIETGFLTGLMFIGASVLWILSYFGILEKLTSR